jgi:hypothetical protein
VRVIDNAPESRVDLRRFEQLAKDIERRLDVAGFHSLSQRKHDRQI